MALITMDVSGIKSPLSVDFVIKTHIMNGKKEVVYMFFLFLLSFAAAVFFGVRWFKSHSFEYLDGVRFSEQLDVDFWLCMATVALALFLGAATFLQ